MDNRLPPDEAVHEKTIRGTKKMKPLTVNPEYRNLVSRHSKKQYEALKKDLLKTGEAIEPIIINKNNVILDGHTRYEICSKNGLFYRTEVRMFDSELDEKIFVMKTNLVRRQLFKAQRISLARKLLEFETQKKAKKQQGIRTDLTSSSAEEKVESIHTDKTIAKMAVASLASVHRVRVVEEKGTKEEQELMFSDEGKIKTAYKKVMSAQKKEKEPIETPPLPDKKYRCLIIDPPWKTQKIERDERPEQGKYLDYPTMSLEEIEKLPIPELAYEEGCHVYLWTTHKRLPNALKLFESWGVKYQCLMTWVKPTGMTPFSWMYNTEHVLFGRIGTLNLEKLGIKLSFEEPSREHSRKPEIFYEIVRKVSPEPRLDMFARGPHEGFDQWGNEVNKFE